MSSRRSHRIAIIGGGLSGLATAAQLHLSADVPLAMTVFESSDQVGGVINTETVDGFLIDHGADMFAINPSAALDLCERLGVQNRLIEPEPDRRGACIVRNGRLIPIPEGFVLMRATRCFPMLRTPLLSWRGKLRFLMERAARAPEKIGADDFDESVADFVRRRMGPEVLDRIVAPLAAGIYTADIERLSMRATMGPIAEMERQYGSLAAATSARRSLEQDSLERASTGARYGQFRAFRGGMAELIGTLKNSLPAETIRVGAQVDELNRIDDQWAVTTSGGETLNFDNVVVATPPRPAAKLLVDIAPATADHLRQIESSSTAIVVLGVRDADINRKIEAFGFVVPLGEKRRILAGSFASHKFAGRAPNGHTLIRVFVGGAMQSDLLEHNDDQLVRLVRDELRDLIGLTGEPVVSRVVRWSQAMPQYHVGHLQKVNQIEASIDAVPGISLISNSLRGVGIAPVVHAAERLAKKLLDRAQT